MSDPNPRLFHVLRKYCEASAIAAAVVGAAVLCDWAFHIRLLESLIPGLVAMKANTALGLIFSGMSLWLLLPEESNARTRHIARLIALPAMLVGAATLCEYRFRVNLGIDQLLFHDPSAPVGKFLPGRMPPSTALAFLALEAWRSCCWTGRRGGATGRRRSSESVGWTPHDDEHLRLPLPRHRPLWTLSLHANRAAHRHRSC